MKKGLRIEIVFILLLMMKVETGFAEDISPGFYVEGLANAAIPMGDDALETTAYFGGRMGYQINPLVSLEVESGHASFEDEFGLGEVTIVPLLANFRLSPFREGGFNLYVLGGIGVIFTDIDINTGRINDAFEESTGIDPEEVGLTLSIDDLEIDNALAGQVGLGLLYYFTEHIAGFVEARILFCEADVRATATASVDGRTRSESIDTEQELGTVFIGGGVRIKI